LNLSYLYPLKPALRRREIKVAVYPVWRLILGTAGMIFVLSMVL
jgi:hypothetical protein